jgi:L-2-hydroxycarboxylate dehydrogenase (NAD+)
MLQQFKVPDTDAIKVPLAALETTVQRIFANIGVGEDEATLAAEVLVNADLRGVDSHGVSNQLRSYIKGYGDGSINPHPNWKVIRESSGTATIDCDRGLGLMLAPKAMDIAIIKAKEVGIGMVTMRRGRHLGMAGYHAMMALKHDMIGICMTAPGPLVLPTFGRVARLGTNPIAFAAPTKHEPPFVLDMATSVIAANKIGLARRLGTMMEPGWVAEADGTPIMEPADPPPPLPDSRSRYSDRILPLGSTRELGSHKGYGLGMMVEIFCAVLSGAQPSSLGEADDVEHFVGAINVDAFTPIEEFKTMMDNFMRVLKETPPAPGHERVLVAGQPEAEMESDRRENGIPLHREVIKFLRDTCKEMRIEWTLTPD